MYIDSFICFPEEQNKERTYVEIFKRPSPCEVVSVLKEYDSGRYGIVKGEVWFWRGDVFHGTVMEELWKLGIYRKWLDWEERLYFERYGGGVIWSTQPYFDTEKNRDALWLMMSSYKRMELVRSGTTFEDLWTMKDSQWYIPSYYM